MKAVQSFDHSKFCIRTFIQNIVMFVYNVVYEDSFRLLNSLFSCPLDAYLECEMKLPSPTRMTSFFVSSIFFSATKKTLTEVAFGHKDHHHYQSYDTYFFSLYLIEF